MERRDFLARAAVAASGLTLCRRGLAAAAALPTVKLGEVPISRFVLGSNPFFGWAHQPGDVGQQMIAWYTDERITAVLDEAASLGVTTVTASPDQRWIDLWSKYRQRETGLGTWLAQCHGSADGMLDEIKRAADHGADAIFIQGHRVEEQFENSTFEVVRAWLQAIQKTGKPAGMAAHRPDVHLEAQRRDFGADFYFQCLYNVSHGDTFLNEDRDKALATIAQLKSPVVAYKLLAAGRNEPQAAIDYALSRLRPTDAVCIGVYPRVRTRELADDVRLVRAHRPVVLN